MEIKIIRTITKKIVFLLVVFGLLQGCASSDLSRDTARGIDKTYSGVGTSLSNSGRGSISESYQNSSQTTKGVFIGGIAGGVIGGFSNGIGAVAGTITGAILGGALGAYIDAHTTIVDKLENRGVKVFILGDQVLMVIPSNRIFDDTTSNLRYPAYSTLDLVAVLIGNFANISVKVAAYTNQSGNPDIDRELAQQQAERVAKYLWKRGVNTRVLYAVGYGGINLVTRNSLGWSCSENYRIEITFEKLPV